MEPPALVVVVEGAMLAVSVRWVLDRAAARGEMVVVVSDSAGACDGCGMPDRAVQMSAEGGSGSDQGTVKRGLSQRLWVLGSS